MKDRDLRIDFLRFVGLSLIIIAHVQAPYTLTQLRCFDVPLMLFVSGLTASGKPIENYWSYIIKRTKRLIVPVWIFLAVYLSCFYFLQFIVLPEQYLTWDMIWRSFLLLDKSIGYVWIIRVFLLVMLLTPLYISVIQKLEKVYISLLYVLGLNVILFCLTKLTNRLDDNTIEMFLIRDVIQYAIAYSIPFIIGVAVKKMDKKQELLLFIGITIVSIVFLQGYFHTYSFPAGISSQFKFPPQVEYITYGSWVSLLLWITRDFWGRCANLKEAIFIGQNTIWIYLWHMPFALFATVFLDSWGIKYMIVYGCATLCFVCQYKVLKLLPNLKIKKYLIG